MGTPVTAKRPNAGAITYTLSGEDAAFLTIDARTGQISVMAGAEFDCESGQYSYTMWITATDGTWVSSTVTVVVRVEDVVLSGMGLRYDANGNEVIDREEALTAVDGLHRRAVHQGEIIEVIRLYFTG